VRGERIPKLGTSRMMPYHRRDSSMALVVVGVDGSPQSTAALSFAAAEAVLRNATLRVVHAWMLPGTLSWSVVGSYAALIDELRRDAQTLLADQTRAAEALVADRVPVEAVLVDGAAASALIAQSADADLLVVGSRGHGGFPSLVLGSVSHALVHHAPCPVVVIRDDQGVPGGR
jgi:nucleotide-binding universal stress UspA family protein